MAGTCKQTLVEENPTQTRRVSLELPTSQTPEPAQCPWSVDRSKSEDVRSTSFGSHCLSAQGWREFFSQTAHFAGASHDSMPGFQATLQVQDLTRVLLHTGHYWLRGGDTLWNSPEFGGGPPFSRYALVYSTLSLIGFKSIVFHRLCSEGLRANLVSKRTLPQNDMGEGVAIFRLPNDCGGL